MVLLSTGFCIAIEVIKELIELSGCSKFLLPSPGKATHITPDSLTRAVSRNRNKLGIEQFSPHDLRRTFITIMRGNRNCRSFVKYVVNHRDDSVTGKHYDRHEYDKEKVMVVRAWEKYLMHHVCSNSTNVLELIV